MVRCFNSNVHQYLNFGTSENIWFQHTKVNISWFNLVQLMKFHLKAFTTSVYCTCNAMQILRYKIHNQALLTWREWVICIIAVNSLMHNGHRSMQVLGCTSLLCIALKASTKKAVYLNQYKAMCIFNGYLGPKKLSKVVSLSFWGECCKGFVCWLSKETMKGIQQYTFSHLMQIAPLHCLILVCLWINIHRFHIEQDVCLCLIYFLYFFF